MKKCSVVVRDEVWCTIGGLGVTEVEFLWNKFGVFVDGYFWMPAVRTGRWDGKVRFYEKTGKTYVRLLDQIFPFVEAWGYEIILDDRRPYVAMPQLRVSEDLFSHIILGGKPMSIRPYQVESANLAIEAGSGFIIAGTGAGKSIICASLAEVYSKAGYSGVTIVPSSDLVDQTATWYRLMGLDTGVYSGDTKDIHHQNIVATWQALQNNGAILSNMQYLIWDEAHGCKAAVAQKLINESGKHIPFRFGVTGTFPKPEADQLALQSSIGPILTEIPAAWLIANGYLAEVEIEPIELVETYVDEEFPDYAAEKAFISKSENRMELIADIIVSKCALHGNTLVLVNSVKFGEKLASLIKGAVFLYGESPKDLRKEHYDMFETQNDLIVIATSGIASTGISIDRVFCLMLVDAGKSFIKAIQSIGRGTRLSSDKTKVHVVDLYSKLKWALKHSKDRVKHYKEAQYPISKKVTARVK